MVPQAAIHVIVVLLHQLQGSSITYRIAVGPQQGKKVHTLQTLAAQEEQEGGSINDLVAKEGGFQENIKEQLDYN